MSEIVIVFILIVLVFVALGWFIKFRVIGGQGGLLKKSGDDLNQKYDNDSKKYNCPYCGEPTISSAQKRQLSYTSSINCPKCGQPITIPYLEYILIMFPATFIFLILGLIFFGFSYLVVLLLIPGAYLSMYLKMKYIPLIKK